MSKAKYCVQLKHKTAPTVVVFYLFFYFYPDRLKRTPKKIECSKKRQIMRKKGK